MKFSIVRGSIVTALLIAPLVVGGCSADSLVGPSGSATVVGGGTTTGDPANTLGGGGTTTGDPANTAGGGGTTTGDPANTAGGGGTTTGDPANT